MTVPVYEFNQRDAADRLAPKRFVDLLVSTGRFWRDEKSLMYFKIAEGDFSRLLRKSEFRQIMEDGNALRIEGGDDNAYDVMWLWLVSRQYTLLRLHPSRPWTPSAPKCEFGAVGAKPMSAHLVRR